MTKSLHTWPEVVNEFWPIKWDATEGVEVGVGVLVDVWVGVWVCVVVFVGVGVCVVVFVGVLVGVGVIVGVTLLVGVGEIGITSPSTQDSLSMILITIFVSSYGGGTSNVNGKTVTEFTKTQFALNESQ